MELRNSFRYPAYRDSGIPWLGDVPNHWEVKKLKHCCVYSAVYGANEPAEKYADEGVRFLRTTDIEDSGVLKANDAVFIDKETIKDYILNDGDILLSRSGTIGRSFLYNKVLHGECSYAGYLVRFVLKKGYFPKFIFYFSKSRAFFDWINVSVIQSTIGNVNGQKYANLSIAIPSFPEQQAIAEYLDRETNQIDTLIAKYTRLLDLLAEKRTALITHTVTHGLPSPSGEDKGEGSYKPSGIPWLGDVPNHWEVKTIKNVSGHSSATVQTGPFGAQLHSSDYTDEGVPLILIKNVFGLKIHDDDIPKISQSKAESLSMYRLQKDDIVFSRVGSIGRIAPVTDKEIGWLISGQMLRLRLNNPDFDNRYLLYVFSCEETLKYVDLHSVGSTRDSINTEILRNMPFVSPPLPEQQAIANYLDQQTAKIDQAREKIQTLIEKLLERRSALITAAVTGKIPLSEVQN